MHIPQFLQSLAHPTRRDAAVRPGLYHYVRDLNGLTARLHLRVDTAGDGVLVANAAALARLSPSGVLIAKGLLDGEDPSAIVQKTKKRFRGVTAGQIAADLAAVNTLIERMQLPGQTYPILNLADPAFSPKAMPLERPISADVPLCPPFHMQQILDRLWQLGILHVTISVGHDPDEAALIKAVERAGDLGLIAGVRGRGTDLGQCTRIADMVASGLDHLDVYCLSNRDEVHNALAGPGDRQKAVRALVAALSPKSARWPKSPWPNPP